jgi:hypothetical protein
MTHKLSQSHFRIQTRSQRHSEGPHPRPCRLTKVLQPSSQGDRSCSILFLHLEWIQPWIDQVYLHPETEQGRNTSWRDGLRTSLLSKKVMGRPADTTTLDHCMSTSSLVLTILNGPSLDERVLLPKFSTTMESPNCELSKDLLVTSLSSCLSCVSPSLSSFTTVQGALDMVCTAAPVSNCP